MVSEHAEVLPRESVMFPEERNKVSTPEARLMAVVNTARRVGLRFP